MGIDLKDIFSCFMVLFAIIDITGATPILLNLKQRGCKIKAFQVSFSSLMICTLFLFLGEGILAVFGVDISSFAIAGSLILLMMAAEMIFGVQIFKDDAPESVGTIVPVIFPLIAGTGTMTTLVALRAEYATINIIIALILNMSIVYLVISKLDWVTSWLREGAIYIMRKVFGLILLAIAIKLFTANIVTLLPR